MSNNLKLVLINTSIQDNIKIICHIKKYNLPYSLHVVYNNDKINTDQRIDAPIIDSCFSSGPIENIKIKIIIMKKNIILAISLKFLICNFISLFNMQ